MARTLKKLVLVDCPALEHLLIEPETFPFLDLLEIRHCRALQSALILTNVAEFKVHDCQRLILVNFYSDTAANRLTNVEFSQCRNLMEVRGLEEYRALTCFRASGCDLTESAEGFQQFGKLESLYLQELPRLKRVVQLLPSVLHLDLSGSGVSCLTALHAPNLASLVVDRCSALHFFPQHVAGLWPALQYLSLDRSGVVSAAGFEGHQNLLEVSARGCSYLLDVTGWGACPKLKRLRT